MDTKTKLPMLLGKEPDLNLNESDISAKIQANFKDGIATSQSFFDSFK